MPTRLLGAGGVQFRDVPPDEHTQISAVDSARHAERSPYHQGLDDLADPKFRLSTDIIQPLLAGEPGEHLIERHGASLRVHIAEANTDPPAVVVPLDRLFDIRVAAALRLWRSLAGR